MNAPLYQHHRGAEERQTLSARAGRGGGTKSPIQAKQSGQRTHLQNINRLLAFVFTLCLYLGLHGNAEMMWQVLFVHQTKPENADKRTMCYKRIFIKVLRFFFW